MLFMKVNIPNEQRTQNEKRTQNIIALRWKTIKTPLQGIYSALAYDAMKEYFQSVRKTKQIFTAGTCVKTRDYIGKQNRRPIRQ